MNDLILDLISHRCRLDEMERSLQYALHVGNLAKVAALKADIEYRKKEIKRLVNLLDVREVS